MRPDLKEVAQGFHTHGFSVLKEFMTDVELKRAESEVETILTSDLRSRPPGDVFYENDGQTVRQLEVLENYSSFFEELSREPRFHDTFHEIFGEEFCVRNFSYMAKAPHIGSAVPAHQDNAYYNLTPNHGLTFWIALDEANENNGCLRVVPGSHHGGIRPHIASGQAGNSYCLKDEPDPVDSSEIPVCLERGDCSIHHLDAIHASRANTSRYPRRALLIFGHSVDCEVDAVGLARYKQAVRQMYDNIASGS
jgi:phytanoyl-CoA hydroxylase